jgi:acyl-coenzyme A synthetase/AMP-(fatty) acid ligase
VLMKNPDILEAAAVGVPDKIYGEEVVCYVVPKKAGVTEEGVQEFCKAYLPPPKIPKRVIIVSDLPKNDRGKVVRDKLREDWAKRGGAVTAA